MNREQRRGRVTHRRYPTYGPGGAVLPFIGGILNGRQRVVRGRQGRDVIFSLEPGGTYIAMRYRYRDGIYVPNVPIRRFIAAEDRYSVQIPKRLGSAAQAEE